MQCMSMQELVDFIHITDMKVLAMTGDYLRLQGEQVFTYLWDYSQAAFCLVAPNGV